MPNALHADLVLKGATILTMDAKDSVAQTVAVKHGRIVGVGTDADVEGLIGRGTHVLDCRGKTIVPGFIDSHTHNTLVGEFRYSFDQLNTAAELNPTLAGLTRDTPDPEGGVIDRDEAGDLTGVLRDVHDIAAKPSWAMWTLS